MTNLALKKLWIYLPKRRQKQFWLILILMILSSLVEIISIGAVLPFLGVLTAPEQVYQHALIQPLIQMLDISTPNQLVLPVTVLFIISALTAGVIRLTLLYGITRFSFAIGADLSIEIYRRTLYQDYSVHLSRNSSEVINGIITKTNTVIGGVLIPILNLISSALLIIAIVSVLVSVNIIVAVLSLIGFLVIYLGIVILTRVRIQENSRIIADNSTQMIKSLQEGLNGIRDVLIDNAQKFYCQLYQNADLPLRRASGNNQFINGSPRYAMEAIGMSLIASIAYMLIQKEGGVSTVIPVLGVFALGAQKLLPALQQVYSSYSHIKGANSSFEDVLSLLNQPLSKYVEQSENILIPFKKEIRLKNFSFRYEKSTPWVLKNINLAFNKGERIGIIGGTGSGKSTLIDIIMGLLSPVEGMLSVDNQLINKKNINKWQKHIAHVPQSVYLSDSTIEENIAFGIPKDEINSQLVKVAAQQAQISDLISGWRDGYKTFVGEQGARLSGGQRQRIGIARALYKKSDVLILDEATSALDNATEQRIMNTVKELSSEITIIIISHKLSTLKDCDRIVKLDKDGVVHVGRYESIVNNREK
jgi:ATP-binding cassette, subfamily B, bacterial PglK